VGGWAAVEPYSAGMIDVGDGHQVYWEVSGAPAGKPAVLLHGGPGSGCAPGWRRWFDPERYQLVAFDQRNSGRSTPHASEPEVDLSANTTQHLIGDMELLRDHLGIDRWLVWGGSWGTTLGLAYAEAHPDRVSEMILVSVGTTTRAEVQWVTRAMGRVFPAEWDRFVAAVPESERADDLAAAYSRLLHNPDPDVRERAAGEWCAWEDTHVATTPGYVHDDRYDDPRFRLCFARLVTHYWSNAAFLDDGELLGGLDRVAGIPAVLIHGRLDISAPPDIPWLLARRWPAAELVLVEDAGHGAGHPTTDRAILSAATRFAEGG